LIFNDIGKLEGEAVIAKLHADCLEEFLQNIFFNFHNLVSGYLVRSNDRFGGTSTGNV